MLFLLLHNPLINVAGNGYFYLQFPYIQAPKPYASGVCAERSLVYINGRQCQGTCPATIRLRLYIFCLLWGPYRPSLTAPNKSNNMRGNCLWPTVMTNRGRYSRRRSIPACTADTAGCIGRDHANTLTTAPKPVATGLSSHSPLRSLNIQPESWRNTF